MYRPGAIVDILSDQRIAELRSEPKRLPDQWRSKMTPTSHAHSDSESAKLEITGESGTLFRVWCRQNRNNPLDFSIGLMVIGGEDGTRLLVRYNGAHPSEHTNKVERDLGLQDVRFRNKFHIHHATQRYQEAGYDILGYAEVTDRYSCFDSALRAMLADNGFVLPDESPGQMKLAF